MPQGMLAIDAEVLQRLGIKDSDSGTLIERMRAAAQDDIDKFMGLAEWPVHAVH